MTLQPANPSLSLPISAAWLYLSDDQNYNTIPTQWSAINFKEMDVVLVGPAGVQADGTFGLYNSDKTGPLSHRLEWALETARSQNPDIKVIVSQWWGSGEKIWGSALSTLKDDAAVETYTDSVAEFLKTWLPTYGGVDGYDIDYEDNNVVENAPTILSQVRSKLDALSEEVNGRPFYVTASPSELTYLEETTACLSYVNMQTYAGGFGLTPQAFLSLGFQSAQLLYGIGPETNVETPTPKEAEQEYESNNLAGIHLWRLNSDNYQHELQWQKEIFAYLHPDS